MTPQEIEKAFEGRWRVKSSSPVAYVKGVRELCRDFFEAGILLSRPLGCDSIAASPQDFDTWWNLYAKKRGKEKCMKKWAKLSHAERKACIDATPTYVASTPEIQYRKDPITYLNNKSWNDEVYISNNPDTERRRRYEAAAGIIARYAEENR